MQTLFKRNLLVYENPYCCLSALSRETICKYNPKKSVKEFRSTDKLLVVAQVGFKRRDGLVESLLSALTKTDE